MQEGRRYVHVIQKEMCCGALCAAQSLSAVLLLFHLSQCTSFHWIDTYLCFFSTEVGVMYSKTWHGMSCFLIFLPYWLPVWTFRLKFSQVPGGNGNHDGDLQWVRKTEICDSSVSGYSGPHYSSARGRERVLCKGPGETEHVFRSRNKW